VLPEFPLPSSSFLFLSFFFLLLFSDFLFQRRIITVTLITMEHYQATLLAR